MCCTRFSDKPDNELSQVSKLYRGVDKYRSPVSGKMTTIFFPLFSGRLATSIAAKAAAPEEMPTSKPSVLDN